MPPKHLFVVSLLSIMLIMRCSCGNTKYKDMEQYVESSTKLNIVCIDEWIYNEEYKSVTLNIRIIVGSQPSLKELKADDKVTFFVKSAFWVSSGLAVSLAGSDFKSSAI